MIKKNKNFGERLRNEKVRLNLKLTQLSHLLYEVPIRTLQSWLANEKTPPSYYQELILFRLKGIRNVKRS